MSPLLEVQAVTKRFGGNAVVAGAWFLDAQGPIWSSLGVIPIYLIGKEVASKRAGTAVAR